MSLNSNEDQYSLPEPYSGKYKGSFAYLTIKDRLPVILVKVIDSLCRHRNEIAVSYGEGTIEDIKEVIGKLSCLQNEMTTNKPIIAIIDGFEDALVWNEYLQKEQERCDFTPAWFDSSWLYAECYFYRRMKQAFLSSSLLKEYDQFHKQKEESFFSTMDAVLFLCSFLKETVSALNNCNKESEKFTHFKKYLEATLWSNKWDLSISATTENIKQMNPMSQLDELREKILVNQTENIYQLLTGVNKSKDNVTIDYVLDNAGFELFCDLVFLQFLLCSKLAKRINIYPKVMPWFVSDTLQKDIDWLLKILSDSQNETLVQFSKDCCSRIQSGEWSIRNENFWTLPHDFSEMQSVDPHLYQRLSQSDLLIFKGDLNYRKLTGDRQWEETTSFKVSLNGFLPTSVATLRTIKADVVVGLKPGTNESLSKLSQEWKFGGDYAVIQFCKL